MGYTYKYPRPAVTADLVVIAREKFPKVLVIHRANEPFKGHWALPGGFMEMDETIEQCAVRELEEETGIKIKTSDLTLLGVYSKVDRDPRGRTISVAFLVELDEAVEVHGQDDAEKAEWVIIQSAYFGAFDHEEIYSDMFKFFEKRHDAEAGEFIHKIKVEELENKIKELEDRLKQYEP